MANYRVALIDSNEVVRAGRAMVISAQPEMDVVLEEADPKLALERCNTYLIDTIIVSATQPGFPGAQFTHSLSNSLLEGGNDSTILVQTAFTDQRLHKEQILAGATDVIGLDQPANKLLGLIKRSARRDYLADQALLSEIADNSPYQISIHLQQRLDNLSDLQKQMLVRFHNGEKDELIAKEFDTARVRVTQLIDSLVIECGFFSRNQLAIALKVWLA